MNLSSQIIGDEGMLTSFEESWDMLHKKFDLLTKF